MSNYDERINNCKNKKMNKTKSHKRVRLDDNDDDDDDDDADDDDDDDDDEISRKSL